MSAEFLTPKPEVIHLDQEFQPINPTRVLLDRVGECHVRFLLESGILPIFTVQIYIQDFGEGYLKTGAFTPFHPEAGYLVTDEDFYPQARRRKTERMELLGIPAIDYRLATKELNGEIEADELKRREFITPDGRNLKPEVLTTLKRLNLQFSFPSGTYESRPNSTYFDPELLEMGRSLLKLGYKAGEEPPEDPYAVDFDNFYPLTRGPLSAYGDDDSTGLKLLVRSQMEELSQIRGKFVLAR